MEALSIGVTGIDQKTVRSLAKLKKLRTLQTVVFDPEFRQSPARRKAIKAALEVALPDCEVHVIFLTGSGGGFGGGRGGMF